MREQRDFSHVRLSVPVEVYAEGVRIERDLDAIASKSGRRDSSGGQPDVRGSKTIWLDPLEGNGECSVEAMCLSHYRSQGWKGYHSEGGIIRTLFAYLFYDILFTYVPNVFQTPFQTCPLDLHTDAFYPSRISEINLRLVQIGNGAAAEIIKAVFDEHAERKTCVVGLDWSFEVEDLLEIADLFNGEALATVCKVMAQEYGTRGGGIPDLFLWHTEQKEVKFAEVKSENDRLSDTQRLWIHVLTGAGVRVELCNAVAKEVRKA
jgi:Fanconi-associated nuclease 1